MAQTPHPAGPGGTGNTVGTGNTAGLAGTAGTGNTADPANTAGPAGTAGTGNTADPANTAGPAGTAGTADPANTAGPAGWPLPGDYVSQLIAGWRTERPDLPVDPVAVVYRICRLAAHFRAEIERLFAGSGISGADFGVLAVLRRSGHPYRLSQRQLMEFLSLTSGTISVRIDRLAGRGLVRRDPDPDDRRGVLVTLTEQGERLFEMVAPEHLANEARLVAALGPAEQSQLAGLLRSLLVEFEPTAGPRPDRPLGFRVAPAHVGHIRRAAAGLAPATGLLVEQVEAGGPAAAAGLRPGDLLVRSGDRELRSLTCLAWAVSASTGRLTLEIQRPEGTSAVAVPLTWPGPEQVQRAELQRRKPSTASA